MVRKFAPRRLYISSYFDSTLKIFTKYNTFQLNKHIILKQIEQVIKIFKKQKQPKDETEKS